MDTQLETLGHFIATEARLQGIPTTEILSRFRQGMEDDDEQDRYDLTLGALATLQEEATYMVNNYNLEVAEIQLEEPDFVVDIFGPKPPYPIDIIRIDAVYSHSGYGSGRQELRAWVTCDDGVDRYAIWTANADHQSGEEDFDLEWWNKDVTKRLSF